MDNSVFHLFSGFVGERDCQKRTMGHRSMVVKMPASVGVGIAKEHPNVAFGQSVGFSRACRSFVDVEHPRSDYARFIAHPCQQRRYIFSAVALNQNLSAAG